MSCNCFNTKPVFLRTDGFKDRLEKSKCRCTSRFNVSERRSSFRIKCNDVKFVDKYKIDGCFDTSTELKCDYLFHYHPIKNNTVSKEVVDYLKPLIQGEMKQIIKDGLPQHISLKN